MHIEDGYRMDWESGKMVPDVLWVLDDYWNENDFLDSYNEYDYMDSEQHLQELAHYENLELNQPDIEVAEPRAYLNKMRRHKIERATGKCNHCGIHRGCNSTNKSRHSDVRKLHKKWSR